MSDPVKSTRLYWLVFASLIVLTVLTVAQSRMTGQLGHTLNRILGLTIAVTKGSLVVLFFMHLKYEKKYFYPIIIFPLILVLIILFANMPDTAFGDHTTPGEEIHGEQEGGAAPSH
ncbi:MAG TPA: cytochrome C oxidase subunit IV family protein [Planctomycetota bacterium]|nr:cytochrome C oxidase subunit IV family protein [Planctomycetota bacterium]